MENEKKRPRRDIEKGDPRRDFIIEGAPTNEPQRCPGPRQHGHDCTKLDSRERDCLERNDPESEWCESCARYVKSGGRAS